MLFYFSLSEITEEALCSVKETQVGKWHRTNKRNLCKNNNLRLLEKMVVGTMHSLNTA